VYDTEGKLGGQSNQVKQPVHVRSHKGAVYVTGGAEVLTAKIPETPGDFALTALPGLNVTSASDLAFTGGSQLYLASRTCNVISKFNSKLASVVFGTELPDHPEFLLHVK
jgi:hypothetical protein